MSEGNFWDADPIATDPAKGQGSSGWWSNDPLAVDRTASKPEAEGDASNGNVISRTWNRIKGKQDPAYANVPAFDDNSFPVVASTALAKFAGADNKAYSDIVQKSLGDRFTRRFQDANGYDIIEYKDANGKPVLGYPKKPGLDLDDVNSAAMQGLGYVGAGKVAGWAMKGAPLVLRGMAQAGAAGTANAAGQGIQKGIGSDQPFDEKQVGAAMLAGGLGEVLPSRILAPAVGGAVGLAATYDPSNGLSPESGLVGAVAGTAVQMLARRMIGVNVGSYVGKDGTLTPRGADVAKAAGIDPATLQGEIGKTFGQAYAATRDASQAAIAAEARNGIPMTAGQRGKDYQQLVREDQMRAGQKGLSAQQEMKAFDELQKAAVKDSAYGGMWSDPGKAVNGVAPPPPQLIKPGVGRTINPSVGGSPVPVQELGESVQGGLQAAREGGKQVERDAWKPVGDIKATPEALDLLPGYIKNGTADHIISAENTPVAAKMVGVIRAFRKGEAPAAGDEFVSNRAFENVDQLRRAIGKMTKDAATPTDREAASSVYRSLNDWTQAAGDAGHLPLEQVSAMRAARPISAEVKGVFSPRLPNGKDAPAANIIQKALQNDSPEGVIQNLIGSSTSTGIQTGRVQALSNIKTAIERYSPDKTAGKQAIDDLRLAYWNKVMIDKGGNLNSYDMIANNVERAFANQKSVLDVLYTPQEQRLMQQLGDSTRRISTKEIAPKFRTNSSGSGFAIGAMARDSIDAVWKALGASKTAQAGIGLAKGLPGVKGAVETVHDRINAAAAKQATAQVPAEIIPSLGPYVSGGYQATRNAFDDRQR